MERRPNCEHIGIWTRGHMPSLAGRIGWLAGLDGYPDVPDALMAMALRLLSLKKKHKDFEIKLQSL